MIDVSAHDSMIVHIHSDDIGATESSTRGMLASWRDGSLDSFSVLANGRACDQVAAALSSKPDSATRIACHLNLSEGPSLAPPGDVPLLVDEEGELNHTFTSLIGSWIAHPRDLVRQVEQEWRAQIQTVQEWIKPRPVDALDGHIHVHMLPFLFPLAARLAAEYAVPSIRISMEPLFLIRPTDVFTRSVGTNLIKNFILGACSWAAVPVARRYRLTWPQYVIGIIYSGQMTMEAALAGIAASRRNGGNHIEVVFHIGRADESERDRWGRRKSIAQFYCSALRDSENEEVTKLATYLNREGFIM